MISALTFTEMDDTHLSGAMRMSQEVSWPHRKEDWAFVAGISKGIVALEGDRVVATALATPFDPVAMVNLVIVDAALRGQGLGRSIMERAMAGLTPNAWRLVATQEGLPLYRNLGFETTGEIVQHQGVVGTVSVQGDATWADDKDLNAILAMDGAATGMDRSSLYKMLGTQARFAVLRDADGYAGFAALRRFGRGEVIGPVIARNAQDARALMSRIMAERAGQFLRVDTDRDTGLGDWLESCGLAHAGGGIKMQKGSSNNKVSSPYEVFALASQALG